VKGIPEHFKLGVEESADDEEPGRDEKTLNKAKYGYELWRESHKPCFFRNAARVFAPNWWLRDRDL
jgi:hypothetical protein